jgi:class 3 adenylate cyclase
LSPDVPLNKLLVADNPVAARVIEGFDTADPVLRLMIEAVHRYDGYVAQSTGDGIFGVVRRSACSRRSSAARIARRARDAAGDSQNTR